MAKSIKYKEADTYHDAGNVYDSNQNKTQEQINASMIPTDEVSFTEQGYTVDYCKSGGIATIMAYKNDGTTETVDITLTRKLPFRPKLSTSTAFRSYLGSDSFMQLFSDGRIRINHGKGDGYYKCVATFIAQDL